MTQSNRRRRTDRAGPKSSRVSRLLDDNDIAQVLEAMGKDFSKVDTGTKRKLTSDINELLTYMMQLQDWREAELQPHERIDVCCKIQNAVAELMTAFKASGPILFDEADKSAPGETPHRLAMPRDVAFEMVANALQGVIQFNQWAESGEKRALDDKGKQTKRFDSLRYNLIWGLSLIYTRIFGLAPTATCRGPWCSFLGEVLCRCEGRRLDAGAVHDIWLKIRKWNESRQRDYPNIVECPEDGEEDTATS